MPSWLRTAPRTLLMIGVLAALGLLAWNALSTGATTTETTDRQPDAEQAALDQPQAGDQAAPSATPAETGAVPLTQPGAAPQSRGVGATLPAEQADDPTIPAIPVPSTTQAPAPSSTDAWSVVARYDFGPVGSPVGSDFVGVTPLTGGPLSFSGGPVSADIQPDPTSGDALTQDGIFSTGIRNFHQELDDGVYRLQITMGSAVTAHDAMVVSVNGAVAASDLATEAGAFTTVVHQVRVRDGGLTVTFADRGGADGTWAVAGITIEARG